MYVFSFIFPGGSPFSLDGLNNDIPPNIGKFESPNLKSSIPEFPDTSLDQRKGHDEVSRSKDGSDTEDATVDTDRSSEPTGTGATFKPGTWQPPT
jgi:NADH dehydrogenase [ubiquinone] 1 alpha subcomplex assembly factor 2